MHISVPSLQRRISVAVARYGKIGLYEFHINSTKRISRDVIIEMESSRFDGSMATDSEGERLI